MSLISDRYRGGAWEGGLKPDEKGRGRKGTKGGSDILGGERERNRGGGRVGGKDRGRIWGQRRKKGD